MLVNLNEKGLVRRRSMVISGSGIGSSSTAVGHPATRAGKANAKISATNEISYNVNPSVQVMAALGVDQVRFSLTRTHAYTERA